MELHPGFDAGFRMPAEELAMVIHYLDIEMTTHVRISIRENQGVTFIREGAADPYRTNTNDALEECTTIVMEDRIREVGIEKALCMMCLHRCINHCTVRYPEAIEVRMYIGTAVDTKLIYGDSEGNKIVYTVPEANHIYHQESERDVVRKVPLVNDEMLADFVHEVVIAEMQEQERAEDGHGNEANAKDGGEGMAKGNENQKLKPEDGDDDCKEDEEMVPQDGDGKEDEDMIPKERADA